MSNIKAVIYDVDGTLINTEPLHVRAWDEALHGFNASLEDLPNLFVQTMAGKKPIIIATEMVTVLDLPVEPGELLEYKTHNYLVLIKHRLDPMPGAIESVSTFKASGYRLAVGTSLDRSMLDKILAKLGVSEMFDVVVTGDQVSKGKPDPETYLKVIEQLNLSADECLVLEDAQSGIESAKAAGAWCIAVKNVAAVLQDTSMADMTVETLLEVKPKLLTTFNR
jgi:HAD superfamily hydrolase (TIGR01509 family)